MKIEINQLSKSFGQHEVLKSIQLEIQGGDIVCFLGPSGCGKSTLLRLIAGLEMPSSGKINYPQEWTSKKSFLSFVFQESALLDWRNVEENIQLPLELLKQKCDSDELQSLLKLVHLETFSDRFPHQLSGGMKMRTSLARALISKPQLLLLDEPFAALDESTRFELQDQTLEIHQQNKMTTLFVTHSISEAVYISDRLILFSKNGGKILFDERIPFGKNRNSFLRTTSEYNSYVAKISLLMKGAK